MESFLQIVFRKNVAHALVRAVSRLVSTPFGPASPAMDVPRPQCRYSTVFSDVWARVLEDELHSDDEAREIIVGHSRSRRLLLVSCTEREIDRVRIISARRAARRELHDYEENVQA